MEHYELMIICDNFILQLTNLKMMLNLTKNFTEMFSTGHELRHFQYDFVDEHLANYYRYYRRYAPKVDIRIVIAVSLTIISVIQVHFVLPHCKTYSCMMK